MWREHLSERHILIKAAGVYSVVCSAHTGLLSQVMYETVIIPYWQKESPKQLEARKRPKTKRWKRKKLESSESRNKEWTVRLFQAGLLWRWIKDYWGARIAWFQINGNMKELTKWIKTLKVIGCVAHQLCERVKKSKNQFMAFTSLKLFI